MKTENLPDGWNKEKIKYLVSINTNHAENNDNYIGMENIESWTGKFVESDGFVAEGETLEVNEGDVIFGKLRPYLAKVYIAEKKACCSTEFLVMQPNEKISSKFLQYSLLNRKTIDDIDRSTYGTKMPRANWDFIGNYKIPVPPFSSQLSIINFLDSKCTKIQAAIDNTKLTIEEYKKLKQAVITKAVTKGLEPNRKMKDSGIEWIGEIPEEWEVRRIKTLFDLRSEKNYLPLSEVNLISLYTDLGVRQHSDIEATTGNKAMNADGYKKVYKDDIVVNIILCWMGAIGRSDYEGVTSPAYDVYKPKDNVNSRFYHYYFRTKGFNGDCFKRGKGIMLMRWRTYSDYFRDISVVAPSEAEQEKIVEYLDRKCSQIDTLISQKEQFITELEKYKQSLIYEYVTGKRVLN